MGAMRLPRPMGIYVPSSPRTLTGDMISPPLSPEFSFDSETVTPSLIPALEYISAKLQQRLMHVTLLIGRGKPYPTGQASDLMIIPIHSIEPQAWRVLERAIAKGSRKFSLGPSWTDALSRSQYERQANDHLVKQSILQNEVIFSQEGLTLLNMDRIYTFKRRMCILSTRPFSCNGGQSMSSCVRLLHRIVADFAGRPFSKAFFYRVYEQLDVPDEQLTAVAVAYKNVHNQDAIILPVQAKAPAPALTTASTAPSTAAALVSVPVPASVSAPVQAKVEATIPAKVTAKVQPKVQAEVQAKAQLKAAERVILKPKTDPIPIRVRAERPREVKRSPIQTVRGRRQPPSSRMRGHNKRGPKTPLSASDVTPITRNEWNILVSQDIRVQPKVTQWTPSPNVLAAA
ncbi:hypothetical protein DTO013E5_4260 [Penicillium roqueforti]|uniref:Genomic scaffold, ProqFM164S01 n=1 Tax=Penicillium roqueforti (strain FM164) TaxID=1365484 RepID=W6PT69_PENRF|nr:hypothetical protein DTO012A1_6028 [Penicillium roqueforti]CDM27075.1 unnamed protein product [Penicillium roqueforti FM164]KAI2753864.1 hypothetical protein DTO013F2_2264 [Penicillium roqueforti]KAI2773559.1 hypothetical protein DTO012A8_1851 [Penicillium roqueforti]KAI3080736.1 hypothetical protein CBS147339_3322 [Penicillium roqueforti]